MYATDVFHILIHHPNAILDISTLLFHDELSSSFDENGQNTRGSRNSINQVAHTKGSYLATALIDFVSRRKRFRLWIGGIHLETFSQECFLTLKTRILLLKRERERLCVFKERVRWWRHLSAPVDTTSPHHSNNMGDSTKPKTQDIK